MTRSEAIKGMATRRRVLQGLGAGALVLGCGTAGGEGEDGGIGTGSTGDGSSGGGGGSTGVGSSGAMDAGASTGSGPADGSESSGAAGDCDPATAWATGGTAAMTATDCYPDPFSGGIGTCALLCQTTAGPCTADTLERQDVSEGLVGLPVRLSLKFVTADDCEPVAGAFVEIWHTQRTGVYSGVTPSGAFCYGNDPDAENYLYFRGSQTTDAEGRVDFDTCYPGWYNGRAIHIHFRVVLDGEEHLVSQLFFEDELNAEICTTHPEYSDRGLPDTTNETDNIIGGEADKSPYTLEVARMSDGAMLAWKAVAIRSSTAEALCTAQGGGGPGGPPPGG
ncbi:MAG: protocatechuate 3,4-dioxygenase [Myxococcales bacterium]|nr:protocatechuate 3,4-dioxygenase [Myxococcales bacterium]